MAALFHLITPDDWAAAQAAGAYHPASLDDEGFVHFSFAEQVADTARRHYVGVTDLLVLEVDPDRLPVAVVVEDSYSSGAAFPHVYAEIPVSAVVAVREFSPGADVAGPALPDR